MILSGGQIVIKSRARDHYAPFRDIWTDFTNNLSREDVPGPTLTVDEQLMPWRGRCGFLQYFPSKPDKYGLKFFLICDSANGYPLHGEPYLGRKGRNRQTNLGRDTAISLSTPYFGSGRNVTADNILTDYTLSTTLLANNLTFVGTVRKNKQFLPPEFQSGKSIKKGEAILAFQKSTTLTAYRSGSKKHVVLLSMMHHNGSFDDDTRKPELVMSYNATKGGVDSMDQMCHALTTKRKTNRWPMVMFYNMLDLASVAYLILWWKASPNDPLSHADRRVFCNIAVAKEMILPHIEQRSLTRNLPQHLKEIIRVVLNPSQQPSNPAVIEATPGKRKPSRCHICPRKKDKKTPAVCDICREPVCAAHSHKRTVCNDCQD